MTRAARLALLKINFQRCFFMCIFRKDEKMKKAMLSQPMGGKTEAAKVYGLEVMYEEES